jgi:hypothetical protein
MTTLIERHKKLMDKIDCEYDSEEDDLVIREKQIQDTRKSRERWNEIRDEAVAKRLEEYKLNKKYFSESNRFTPNYLKEIYEHFELLQSVINSLETRIKKLELDQLPVFH